MVNAFQALIQDTSMSFLAAVHTREIRAYHIGANGKILDTPVIEVIPSPNTGQASGLAVPWQNSLAITFKAGALGKGRFGRIYLPPQNYSMTPQGTVAAESATNYGTGVSSFLAAIQLGVRTQWPDARLVVAGKTGPLGTIRRVEELRVGKVVDTQRRRRRSIPETPLVMTGASAASSWNAA